MKKTHAGRVGREGHVKSGVETGVMLLQVKEHPESPEGGRSKDRFSPGCSRTWSCQQLDFILVASRTVREYISIVLGYLCVTLL